MPPFFRPILAIAIAALALLLAGCGSSGGDSKPLNEAAYLKQANQICREAQQQQSEDLKAATEDSDGSGGEEELAHFVEVSTEPIEDMAGELSDLKGPAAQRKAVAKLVNELTKEIEKIKATPSDPVSDTSFESANAAARQAQLYDCEL